MENKICSTWICRKVPTPRAEQQAEEKVRDLIDFANELNIFIRIINYDKATKQLVLDNIEKERVLDYGTYVKNAKNHVYIVKNGLHYELLTHIEQDGKTHYTIENNLKHVPGIPMRTVHGYSTMVGYSSSNTQTLEEWIKEVHGKEGINIDSRGIGGIGGIVAKELFNKLHFATAMIDPKVWDTMIRNAINVGKWGWALRIASGNLCNDKALVLNAVKNYGYSLKYASDVVKKDRDVVMAAVTNNWRALEFASEEMKKDKYVVTAAVKQNGAAIKFASDDLKNDEGIKKECWTPNNGDNVIYKGTNTNIVEVYDVIDCHGIARKLYKLDCVELNVPLHSLKRPPPGGAKQGPSAGPKKAPPRRRVEQRRGRRVEQRRGRRQGQDP